MLNRWSTAATVRSEAASVKTAAPAPKTPPLAVTVIVQGVSGRGKPWDASRESIERSDIGTSYELMMQPPDLSGTEHFMSVLRRMGEATTPLVIRLEDDAIVNRHLLYNCGTWPALSDRRFGVGWLMSPGGAGTNIWDYMYGRREDGLGRWWNQEMLHVSVGTLLRTEDVPKIIETIKKRWATHKGRFPQDLALSSAAWWMGKRVALHNPSIVEHPLGPSSLGHHHSPRHDTSDGTFRSNWRRAG